MIAVTEKASIHIQSYGKQGSPRAASRVGIRAADVPG